MQLSNSSIAGAPNALALINPNDIASFTILKTHLQQPFMVAVPRMVLLSTTKKGQKGKPKFHLVSIITWGTGEKGFCIITPASFVH